MFLVRHRHRSDEYQRPERSVRDHPFRTVLTSGEASGFEDRVRIKTCGQGQKKNLSLFNRHAKLSQTVSRGKRGFP